MKRLAFQFISFHSFILMFILRLIYRYDFAVEALLISNFNECVQKENSNKKINRISRNHYATGENKKMSWEY